MKKYYKKFQIPIFFTALITVLLSSFLFLHYSQALTSLHTISDRVTRHAPSTASDHLITFTSPLGINAVDDYFIITFDSGFDLSAINYMDIDLKVNSAEQDLQMIANSVSWGVLVNNSAKEITFYHPTTASGGTNQVIAVEIGKNADSGFYQIINPATLGSVIISISTSNDELGKLAVPVANDQVGISGDAWIPPPIILAPPFNITSNSMELTWDWQTSSDPNFEHYELWYSTTPNIDPAIPAATATMATLPFGGTDINDKDFTVTGLTANTTYYFIIISYNTMGYSRGSNEVTGTTTGGGVHPPPTPAPVETPLIVDVECPFFNTPVRLAGTRPADSRIVVNGSEDNVVYYDSTNFSALLFNPETGDNMAEIYAYQPLGGISETLNILYKFWHKGDNNINYLVEDRDIALLAGCFYSGSDDVMSGIKCCLTDFNEDGTINDFDIAPLAFGWDNRYILEYYGQCRTLGDINNDFFVNSTDFDLLVLILTGQLPYNSCADINQDGLVGPSDYTRMNDKVNLGLNWW